MVSIVELYGRNMVVVSLLDRTRVTTAVMLLMRIRVRDIYVSIVMRCPNMATASMGIVPI